MLAGYAALIISLVPPRLVWRPGGGCNQRDDISRSFSLEDFAAAKYQPRRAAAVSVDGSGNAVKA